MKKRLNIFLLAFPLCPVFQIQAQEKPNLVFIMADQWRGDALGCLGKEPVKTPCLDQLAREGVISPMLSAAIPYLHRHEAC